MKILLDTNIIVYREASRIYNNAIGDLFYWFNKLHHDTIISPLSIAEIEKYADKEVVKTFKEKIKSYIVLPTVSTMPNDYKEQLVSLTKNENDEIDNNILYELLKGRVDLLITEDKKIKDKAKILKIEDKVYNIEDFLYKCKKENPELINYRVLSVVKKRFGDIDINDEFFNNFINDYNGFKAWFNKKQDEYAYVCYQDDKLLGFLYIKKEDINENYNDIVPQFKPKTRLKIGTFKVVSSGFRLGERFLKIIFDNAKNFNVDEIYVTLFDKREELKALSELMQKWGFIKWGVKKSKSGTELVLVKDLKTYHQDMDPRFNYPVLKPNSNKYILPIYPQYHTDLLPDAMLNNECDNLKNIAYRYALQKVYVSFSYDLSAKPGDRILIYRMKDKLSAAYSSVLTSLCIIQDIKTNFNSEAEFIKECQNRSIFSEDELRTMWNSRSNKISVIKFIFVKQLNKKIPLKTLWDNNIISYPNGPRPFTLLQDKQYDFLLNISETTEV